MASKSVFSGTIAQLGSRRYLTVPFDPDLEWGEKARHSVAGTVNGLPIRGTLAKFGNEWGLPAGPVWLRDNRLATGAKVEAVLWPEGPQLENIGEDFAHALKAEPTALKNFENLTTFHRKNYVRWIDSAKRSETRTRRIQEAIRDLVDGKLR